MYALVPHDIVQQLPVRPGRHHDSGTQNAHQPRRDDPLRFPNALLQRLCPAQLQPRHDIERRHGQKARECTDHPNEGAGLEQPSERVRLIGDREIALRRLYGVRGGHIHRNGRRRRDFSCAEALEQRHEAPRHGGCEGHRQPQRRTEPQRIDCAARDWANAPQQPEQQADQTSVQAEVQDPVEDITFHSRRS